MANNYPTNYQSNQSVAPKKQPFSAYLQKDACKNLINNTLGDKEVARRFVAEISSVVSQNKALGECDNTSLLSAGLLAQTLDLSLSPSLGLAYVVPYGKTAQFQVGYKGLIQLSLRSNQFERLGVREVHEGEYEGQDEFGDDMFHFSHDFDAKPIVGYFAYFVLKNGFKKTFYMTKAQAEQHARRYSKAFAANWGGNLWRENFDFMACKTVLKLLLNRYAPLSIQMQTAIEADQAAIKEDGSYEYVDNETESKTNVTIDIIPEPNDGNALDDDDEKF